MCRYQIIVVTDKKWTNISPNIFKLTNKIDIKVD